ncbi:hypothetical protein SRABI106_02187 [Rahnella aquatilis]|nr:hypothetical protein SRABI106_02187 [Rahnella aquatilis]
MINHDQAVTIAVKSQPDICFFSQNTLLQLTDIRCAAFFVDVHPIRLTADSDDFCPQFAQNARCNVISSAVGTVDHNFQTVQTQFCRECAFTEFDVTTGGIHDAAGFTQFGRFNTCQWFFKLSFNRLFHFVR